MLVINEFKHLVGEIEIDYNLSSQKNSVSIIFYTYHMNKIKLIKKKYKCFKCENLRLKHIKCCYFFHNRFNWILIPIYFS